MLRYIVVSVISGILLNIMDGVINAVPLTWKLYQIYLPIARTSINPYAGIIIDLMFGFIMAALFLLLYPGLPGKTKLVKGISFALFAWFFRVVMCTTSQWMLFDIPVAAILYSLATGLGEMLVLGLIYGLDLKAEK